MPPDFPAAHSMDTTWFAIDERGHVAAFESGEGGHIPEQARDEELLFELWRFRHPGGDEEFWDADAEDRAAQIGLFYYAYDEELDLAALYDRFAIPETPLHVDQLPPALRQRCKRIRFRGLDFARDEHIQPLEHGPCAFWYDEIEAYLACDGKTVRPIPGKEARFADFCREFREQYPEEATELLFEGMPPEQPGQPRRPKEGEDRGQ
jgi:hypothetical protein